MVEPVKNSKQQYSNIIRHLTQKPNQWNKPILSLNNNTSDGTIGHFKQSSQTGDCYLLASLYSISKTTVGAEIIKNNITKNKNGTYTITLPGAKMVKDDYENNNKRCFISGTYTITPNEIRTARKSGKYSKGDFDVLLYELAFEKYRKEVLKTNSVNNQTSQYGMAGQYTGHGTIEDPLSAGQTNDAIFILTGKKSMNYYISSEQVCSIDSNSIKSIDVRSKKLSKLGVQRLLEQKNKNPNQYAITFSLKLDNGEGKHGYHALSVSRVENGRVYFINPWNSDKEFSLTTDEFFRSAYNINVTDFEQTDMLNAVIDNITNGCGFILDFFHQKK